MRNITMLKLAQYLLGKYTANVYSEQEIAGFLYGLRFNKQVTNNDINLILRYIFPEVYFKNYTEIDYYHPKIKKKLNIELRTQQRGW